jgi:hypothetical protein
MYNALEEFDEVETPSVLSDEIQTAVDRIIKGTHDVDWNEDSLTIRILGAIRNILSNYKIPFIDDNTLANKFDVEAYKLTGNPEHSHGDIAIIVTRLFPYFHIPTSGVAFYEAKAASNGRSYKRFPSFSIQQLRRLVTNTPRLTYLIYDRNKRVVGSSDWPVNYSNLVSDYKTRYKHQAHSVRSYTVDANFLKNVKNIDCAVNLYGRTSGEHFVKSVLSGRELDYSRSVKKTIRKWLKITKKSNPLIVSISVHKPGDDLAKFQLELPGIKKIRLPESNELLKLEGKRFK